MRWVRFRPTAANDSTTTDEDTQVTIDLTGNDTDVDGTIDNGTLAIVQPANGTDNGDGTVSYTPNANFFGSDSFTYTVQDDDGATSNSATISITVNQVDTVNQVITMPVGTGTITVALASSDITIVKDGQTVDTIPLGSVQGITLIGAEESETFEVSIDGLTPENLPAGITIHAGEGTGDDDTLVLNGSDIIESLDYNTTGPEAGTITIDGFTVTFSEFEPIIDRLTVANRSFTIGTPGSQTIILGDNGTAGDLVGGLSSISFELTVNPTSTPPVALDQTVEVTEDGILDDAAFDRVFGGFGEDWIEWTKSHR